MVTADSTRFLLISNAVAAGMALVLRWPVETLLWPYWIQSVIIGWYSRKRVLALKNFSTEGFTMNDAPVPATAASFAVSHRKSFQQNLEADARGRPNVGVLMFLPYARILPMHFTIILGHAIGGNGAATVLLFSALKTGADVLMHYVNHSALQRSQSPAQSANAR